MIFLHALRKTFSMPHEDLHILRGIDLQVPPGATCAISGESGSGKTTLLSIVAGIDRASGGSVSVDGCALEELDEEALGAFRGSKVGFVFQLHFLLDDFTTLENVMLPALLAGHAARGTKARAKELLSKVDMFHRLDHKPPLLSGGERQRVAVARALINDPAIIVADEPTGSLDEKNSRAVEELLFAMAEDFHKTMLLATHDERVAARADRLFHLEGGLLV